MVIGGWGEEGGLLVGGGLFEDLRYIKRGTRTRMMGTLQRGKGHTSSGNLFYIFEIRILTIKITIKTLSQYFTLHQNHNHTKCQ